MLPIRQLAIPFKYLLLKRLTIIWSATLTVYQEQHVRSDLPPVELLKFDHRLQRALGYSEGRAINPCGPPEPVEDNPSSCAEGWNYVSFNRVDMCRNVQHLETCRAELVETKFGSVVVQVVDETAQGTWLPSRERHVFAGNARLAQAVCELPSEGALANAVGPLEHDEYALCSFLRHMPSRNWSKIP